MSVDRPDRRAEAWTPIATRSRPPIRERPPPPPRPGRFRPRCGYRFAILAPGRRRAKMARRAGRRLAAGYQPTLRPTDLVAADGRPGRRRSQPHRARSSHGCRLHGIGVQQGEAARRPDSNGRSDPAAGLHAGLVIGQLDRDHAPPHGSSTEPQTVQVHAARRRPHGRHPTHLQTASPRRPPSPPDARLRSRRPVQVWPTTRTQHGQIVRLGPSDGERDAGGINAEEAGGHVISPLPPRAPPQAT